MYYVIEHQKRPDGIINAIEKGYSTLAIAKSYYHDRYSKMVVNESFEWVALLLTDETLNVIERDVVDTQYREVPEDEPSDEPTEESTEE